MVNRELHDVFEKGIKKAWEEDRESQENFIKVICEARGMKQINGEKYSMLFVPNNEYLIKYCGPDVVNLDLGCYTSGGECIWSNCLLIPIFNVNQKIVGLCGFNPLNYAKAHETQDWECIYYQYSSKNVFTKGSYLFDPFGCYEKALEDGYLFVVDGVFDAISLAEEGFNAVALMDSAITVERVALLRFIKNVIVIPDNDEAGFKVLDKLEKKIKRLKRFTQGIDKDIDGALKSESRDLILKELKKVINDSKEAI